MSTEPELSDAEKAMAAAFGMSTEEYANYKQRQPTLPSPADAEHEKLKQAVREVLEARDWDA